MKVLCGTDIIETSRIKENIEKFGEKFLNRIYTTEEIKYCESKNIQKYQYYAARFAAKEAVFKAVSELLDGKYEINWKNIEIQHNETNKPKVVFVDIDIKDISNIDVSISHIKEYAIATVMLLTK